MDIEGGMTEVVVPRMTLDAEILGGGGRYHYADAHVTEKIESVLRAVLRARRGRGRLEIVTGEPVSKESLGIGQFGPTA